MALVQDAHNWKKWWSMRFIIASAFFSAIIVAYGTLPSDWLPDLPSWIKQTLAIGALASAGAAAVARVMQQPKLEVKDEQ